MNLIFVDLWGQGFRLGAQVAGEGAVEQLLPGGLIAFQRLPGAVVVIVERHPAVESEGLGRVVQRERDAPVSQLKTAHGQGAAVDHEGIQQQEPGQQERRHGRGARPYPDHGSSSLVGSVADQRVLPAQVVLIAAVVVVVKQDGVEVLPGRVYQVADRPA